MTVMEDYGDTLWYTELKASVSLHSIVEDRSPPSSHLLPERDQQEVMEKNEGGEENVVIRVRQCMFEPLVPADIQ